MNDAFSPTPESVPLKVSLEKTCLFHLVALKYAMAGDLESDSLLHQLEARWRAIKWKDPEFIQFSDAMRNGPPHLISQNEMALVPDLQAFIHDQGELLADFREKAVLLQTRHDEAMKMMLPALQMGTRILVYIRELIKLSGCMRARLRAVGEDTSPFKLPPSPFPPTL